MYSITIIAKEWIMPNAKAICVKIKSNPTPPPFSRSKQTVIMITM